MKTILTLLIALTAAFYFRAYTISDGLPYFYDEDEAHHFNRTANMAISGDMNPRYFHKPSLHFYLRIPVIWFAVEWSKQQGYLNKIEEIRTYNRFGLARYAFTASHPGIVKWVRALSVLFSILIVFFTFLSAKLLSKSTLVALCSALIVGISPPLIEYAGTVGVDVLMSMMCLISVYCALKYGVKLKTKYLVLSAFFAGLAVSSKYNALPICAVPLIACYLNKKLSRKTFIYCCTIPVFAFFLASPYILISPSSFINELGYEVWHYSVAGHEGHSANRGFDQALFYFNWFVKDALGYCLSSLALAGLIYLSLAKNHAYRVFIAFPVLYFVMMTLQKTNFTRNMLVILPFLAIFAMIALYKIINLLNLRRSIAYFAFTFFFVLSCSQPFRISIRERAEAIARPESRKDLTEWIFAYNDPAAETAISGQLLLEPKIPLTLPNVTTIDESNSNPTTLLLDGYDRVVTGVELGPISSSSASFLKVIANFPGTKGAQRIIQNPEINIYNVDSTELDPALIANAVNNCPECKISFKQNANMFTCHIEGQNGTEDYCWLKKRFHKIELPGLSALLKTKKEVTLSLQLMSPWEGNTLSTTSMPLQFISLTTAGTWNTYTLKITSSDLIEPDTLIVRVDKIHSPLKKAGSGDSRRLGIAVKSIEIPTTLP